MFVINKIIMIFAVTNNDRSIIEFSLKFQPQGSSIKTLNFLERSRNLRVSFLAIISGLMNKLSFLLKNINIPYKYLLECNENGTLKQLAVFFLLKKIHSNSCIYNYNPHLLAKKSGLSITAIKRYIKIFLDNQWCRMHSRNLIFNKLDGTKYFQIKCEPNVKTILSHLHLKLLDTKVRQCEYVISKKRDLVKPKNLKAYKSARKYFNKAMPGEINSEIRLSSFALSCLYNCSKSKANKILKSLKESSLIMVQKNRKVLFRNVPLKFFNSIRDDIQGYTFWYRGTIYKQQPNLINIFR